MKVIIRQTFIVSIFLSLICGNLFAQDEVLLKYDFKIGDTAKYNLKIDGDVNVEISSGKDKEISKNSAKMDGVFSYTHKIVRVDEQTKSTQLNVIYGKSYMNTIVQNKIIPNKDLEYLEGKVAQLTLNSKGEVEDYILPKDLPLSLQNADFRKMFVIFPERKLHTGESWIKSSENTDNKRENFKITNTIESTYTFLGIEKKNGYTCAKVKLKSNTRAVTEPKNPQLIMDSKISGFAEGMMYFNIKNGQLVYSKISNKINNVVKTQENGSANPITTNVDTSLTIITELI